MSEQTTAQGFVLRQPPAPPGGPLVRIGRLARLGARLASLGTGPLDRARLFAAPLSLVIARHLGVTDRFTLTVSISAFGRSARCTIAHFLQLLLLEAIFLDGDYAIEPLGEPETIVDLGSNVGISILYYRLRFPGARIIGVEPDPVAYALLGRNVAGLADVEIHHAAVGESDSTTTLWSAPGA